MMPPKRRAAWTIAAILIAVAACCRDGPTHKCDFTPPTQGGGDGGSDGPVMCGTEICEAATQVCCVTKAPLNATCIPPAQFESLRCEKIALPCLKPTECPGGLACCVALKPDGTGTVTCMQEVLCVAGEMTFVACASEADCPAVRPACISIGSTPQGDFKVCM